MLERIYINWICTELPEGALTELNSILINHDRDPRFRDIVLDADDPDIDRITSILQESGARPQERGERQGRNEYHLNRSRVWEQADCDAAEYLQLKGLELGSAGMIFRDDRVVRAQASFLVGKRRHLLSNREAIICSDLVAGLLAVQFSKEIRFEPILIVKGGPNVRNWQETVKHETWWQLISTRVLPPMSPRIERWVARGLKPSLRRVALSRKIQIRMCHGSRCFERGPCSTRS